jgi:multiple sugar transport system ATP-binding protein
MSVAENMAFSLKMARVGKEERSQRVMEAAKLLDLEEYLDRKPKALSGGQRQRVAMGRAIVRKPQVFCMDEPLSNLDAKLRVSTRTQIAALQQRLGVTTVYVTHDQTEAMTMGDRVAVMKNGRIQQCAPPQELYEQPANVFVAGFIGSPKMNLFHSILFRDGKGGATLQFGPNELAISPETITKWPGLRTVPDGPITVGLRPESFRYTPNADPDQSLDVQAKVVEMLGNETLVHFVAPVEQASDADVRDRAQASDEEESILAGAGQTMMVCRLVPPVRLSEGDAVRLTLDTSRLYLFDQQGDAIR